MRIDADEYCLSVDINSISWVLAKENDWLKKKSSIQLDLQAHNLMIPCAE